MIFFFFWVGGGGGGGGGILFICARVVSFTAKCKRRKSTLKNRMAQRILAL